MLALRRFFWGLVPVIILLLLLSGRVWVGQLLIHFSVYILVFIWFLYILSWRDMSRSARIFRGGVFILMTLLLLWTPLHIRYAYPSSDVVATDSITSWNMQVDNDHYEDILAQLAEYPSHVHCAQETDSAKAALLARVFEDSYIFSRSDPFGNSMYAQDSVISKDLYDINSIGHVMVRMLVERATKRYSIYSVHIPPPLSAQSMEVQKESLLRIAQIIGADTLPKILCGDFNTSTFSPYFADFLYRSDLQKVSTKNPLFCTWRLWMLPLLEIDHMLISQGIRVCDYGGGEYVHSDHRLLYFSFCLTD